MGWDDWIALRWYECMDDVLELVEDMGMKSRK